MVSDIIYNGLYQLRAGSSVGIATHYGLHGQGIKSRRGARSAPVQTGPGAHPASCSIGTRSFPRIKWKVRDVDSPSSSAGIKERVELYIYSRFWVFVSCSMVQFVPFTFVATVSANKNKFELLLVYLPIKEKGYLSCTIGVYGGIGLFS
jgi:hypothetical protein